MRHLLLPPTTQNKGDLVLVGEGPRHLNVGKRHQVVTGSMSLNI